MMTKESIPNNSVTNGGNGGYMNKRARMNMYQDVAARMAPKQTATGRPALVVTKKTTKF
jgi:hypothetical protein